MRKSYHSEEEKEIATMQHAQLIIDPTVEIFKIKGKSDVHFQDLYESLLIVQLSMKISERTLKRLFSERSDLILKLTQQEAELIQLRIQNENLKDGI
jgi:hypothetical protein